MLTVVKRQHTLGFCVAQKKTGYCLQQVSFVFKEKLRKSKNNPVCLIQTKKKYITTTTTTNPASTKSLHLNVT